MRNISSIKDPLAVTVVQEIKNAITSVLGDELKEIILYGSYARQGQTRESDIDIVVLVDNHSANLMGVRRTLARIKVDLSLKYDLIISIIVKSHSQYLEYRDLVPFYSAIDREGIEIYG